MRTSRKSPSPVRSLRSITPLAEYKLFTDELPPVVKDVVEGWTSAISAIAVIVRLGTNAARYVSDQPQTALFTGVQSTLLQILGPGNIVSEPVSAQVLRWFTYGSIIFNLGASTSAVFCLIIFSDISTHARRRAIHDDKLPAQVLRDECIEIKYLTVEKEGELLREFGINPIFGQAKRHMICCFVLGVLCTFIDIAIWTWQKETLGLTIAILVCLGVVGLPLGQIFFRLIRPPSARLRLLVEASNKAKPSQA